MSSDLPPRDEPAAEEEQHSAGSIQSRIEGREECILLRNHAAGLVERRLPMRKAIANIASENRSNVASDEISGNIKFTPRDRNLRNLPPLEVSGLSRISVRIQSEAPVIG